MRGYSDATTTITVRVFHLGSCISGFEVLQHLQTYWALGEVTSLVMFFGPPRERLSALLLVEVDTRGLHLEP